MRKNLEYQRGILDDQINLTKEVRVDLNCKIDNIGENLYANKYKNAAYCNFTFGPNPNKDDVLFYLLVEEEVLKH